METEKRESDRKVTLEEIEELYDRLGTHTAHGYRAAAHDEWTGRDHGGKL